MSVINRDGAHNMKYKKMTVDSDNPVSVEQVNVVREKPGYCYIMLIMGPTGAGKSTFIESLGLKFSESISSNGLEGFTQKVSTYRLNNVSFQGDPMYLIDSPGFADTNISEAAIVSMLKDWLRDNKQYYFHRILYFVPVTQVRMSGSQRQVLRTFEALTGIKTSYNITIVTTMWDSLWGERAVNRAEETFIQLRDDVWKESVKGGAQIVKFRNSQNSSLSVLDDAVSSQGREVFHIEKGNIPMRDAPFYNHLLADLKRRITNLQSEIAIYEVDLEYAETHVDGELQFIVKSKLEEAERRLKRFKGELCEFFPGSLGHDLAETVDNRDCQPISARTVLSTSTAGHEARSTQDLYRQGGWVEKIAHLMCYGKGVAENHKL